MRHSFTPVKYTSSPYSWVPKILHMRHSSFLYIDSMTVKDLDQALKRR